MSALGGRRLVVHVVTFIVFCLCSITLDVTADDTVEPVSLQLKWKHAFQFAGYYAALEKGYYRERGLDLSIREHDGKRTPAEVLLAGDAEYAVTGSVIAVYRAQGKPVVALATIFQHSPLAFLVRADSGITRVEDFIGKRVMLGSGIQDAALDATLRRAGVEEGSFVRLPSNFDARSLLRDQTDIFNAYVTDQGFILHEGGVGEDCILPKQYGVDFYGDVLATTEEEIKQHPKRVKAFREATLKGWNYALDHPAELIGLILEKYNTQKMNREHLEYEARASRELIQPLLVRIGHMNPARWEHIKQVFTELGFIGPDRSIEGLVYLEQGKGVVGLAQWVIDNRVSVAIAAITLFVSILLFIVFQLRRLVRQRTTELEASEKYMRTLIDTAPVCVKVLDREGRLVDMNLAGLAMIQADSVEQVKNARMADLVDQESRRAFIQLSQRVFEGESGSLLFRAKGLKGRQVWLETRVEPILGSAGEVTQLLGITLDVTAHKEAEDEQNRLHRELRQVHKMEALGQLTGGIAHDFNNLLGIIVGYSELAQHTTSPDDASRRAGYLKNVQQAADRASKLVAQMLTFSRSNETKGELLQLAPLVKQDVEMLRSSLPSSIEIRTEIREGLPSVLLDRTQLNQILMNLAINARDAMEGKGVMTVRLDRASAVRAECSCCHKWVCGDWIALSVSDTGGGIEPGVIPRIFEPFFTTKEVGKGTGMGMSVIQGIVLNHGGHVLLETESGTGTSVKVLFPPVIGNTSVASDQAPKADGIPLGQGERVLVLDDEPDLAEYLGDMLLLRGYRVVVQTNSQAALRLFSEAPDGYDLVITDQTMPELTGVELVRAIRGIRADLPIILMTGYSNQINEEQASAMGLGFVAKPIESELLISAVSELLRPAKAKEPVETSSA